MRDVRRSETKARRGPTFYQTGKQDASVKSNYPLTGENGNEATYAAGTEVLPYGRAYTRRRLASITGEPPTKNQVCERKC